MAKKKTYLPIASLLRQGGHAHRTIRGTPASLYTHKVVMCNTAYPERTCRVHRSGSSYTHRVAKEAYMSLKEMLGK